MQKEEFADKQGQEAHEALGEGRRVHLQPLGEVLCAMVLLLMAETACDCATSPPRLPLPPSPPSPVSFTCCASQLCLQGTFVLHRFLVVSHHSDARRGRALLCHALGEVWHRISVDPEIKRCLYPPSTTVWLVACRRPHLIDPRWQVPTGRKK